MSNLSALTKRLENIWQPADFETLFRNIQKQPHSIKKKTILFNDGDPLERLYYIKEGFIKLYRLSKEGKETTSYLYGAGDIIGLRSLTSKDKCARHNAEAITNIKVMTISHQEFFDTCLDHPEYLVDLIQVCLNRLIYTETRLESFIATDSTTRVAIFLNYCIKRFGKENRGKIALPLALTHQLIAEFIGSVRETVTVVLNRLENEKILKIEKGKITILDKNKLKTFSRT